MTVIDLIPGDRDSSVIIHVPHSSTEIPPSVRSQIQLSDSDLALEILRMTDSSTRKIAESAHNHSRVKPWLAVNRFSRLVVDPERFPDEREEMESVGMGAVYTRTHDGRILRELSASQRQELLTAYFEPYSENLLSLVDNRLGTCGQAILVDLHSYPSRALPYELHQSEERPAVCIGVDTFHTPGWLVDAVTERFSALGSMATNTPFSGTYVPLVHYQQQPEVLSVMIEIRRDLYMDEETGIPDQAALAQLSQCLTQLADQLSTA